MGEKIKKKDFVEIEYTGRLTNEGYIFDTTQESVAKENGLFNPGVKYGPIVTCVGEGLILSSLDESLIDKELGKEYDININAGNSFGKRNASKIKLMPMNVFKKQNINPMPGLQVTFDGELGTVKNVSGGRVIVDFNHPLSGKDLSYHVKINKIVTDKVEQTKSLLELKLNIRKEDLAVVYDENLDSLELTTDLEIPIEIEKKMIEFISDCVKVKKVSFKIQKQKKESKTESKS